MHDGGSMKHGDYHQEDLTEVFRVIEEEQGTKADNILHFNYR